jgi:flavin-dependent dehydrogenase
LGQDFKITDNFKIRKYMLGICDKPRIGNTLFTGNCFGTIMPFLGFGQFASILTGIYAAYDLCGQGDYNELTKSLKESFYNSLTLRRGLEKIDNAKLDLLVKSLKGKLGTKLFNSKKYNFLKITSYLLKPWIKMTSS